MKRNRILNILCVVLLLLIIGIVGFAFYVIFLPDENTGVYGELSSFNVIFDLNGADFVEKKVENCTSQENCVVTLPSASRKDGQVLGYDTSPVAVSPKYKIGDQIKVNNNVTFYVISYKENEVNIIGDEVDYLEKNKVSCKAFNKEKTCFVKLPTFNKIGYENRGYSSSNESKVGYVFPNEKYKISRNITLYPIYGVNNHQLVLRVSEKYMYHNSFIEVETGCGDDVYTSFLEYIDEISKKAPFLLNGNKISFVTDETFDFMWGSQYVGMNYGPYGSRSLDVRCSYKIYNDYYATMVHELTHSWDFFYGSRIGDNLSTQSDIINLFNKYSALDNKPFRDYSFSNIYEFLADSLKYYYFKYLVPRDAYKDLSFPDDIKTTLEKYICIAGNDYEEEGC